MSSFGKDANETIKPGEVAADHLKAELKDVKDELARTRVNVSKYLQDIADLKYTVEDKEKDLTNCHHKINSLRDDLISLERDNAMMKGYMRAVEAHLLPAKEEKLVTLPESLVTRLGAVRGSIAMAEQHNWEKQGNWKEWWNK